MPSILNVGNLNNSGTKKLSSKLSFDVGEKFSGRLIKDDNTGSYKIKLADGWSFDADLEENVDDSKAKGMLKFEVTGFENGKLKLKIISTPKNNEVNKELDLEGFIKQQGLPKEDLDLIKDMVKHDMPISKDEILKLKSLLKFKGDININKESINKFINSFLKSKGIDLNSVEGKKISEKLNEFFNKFATLKNEEVLLMTANGIDVNSDNIESFLKVINGEENILNKIESSNKNLDSEIKSVFKDIILKNKDLGNIKNLNDLLKNLNNTESKDIVKGLLKECANSNTPIIKLDKKEISDMFVKMFNENINIDKKDISVVKDILLKENNNGFKPASSNNKLTDILKNVLVKNENLGLIKNAENTFNNFNKLDTKEILNKLIKTNENNLDFKLEPKGLSKIFSNLLGENIVLSNEDTVLLNNALKENLNSLKNTTHISNENKLKNTSNSTKDVLKYLSENIEKEINANSTEDKDISTIIKNQSEKSLNKVTKELPILKQTSATIQEQIKENFSHIKDVIKSAINNSDSQKLNIPKEFIKDMQIFNKLNENYYLIDIPVRINEKQLDCKLMIKDDRKSGKKVDSKNVNLVVTVATLNMGKIDGYLKVRENNLKVDLKCDDKWIKPIDLGKEVLMQSLKNMGYNVSIVVSKKEKEANLVNCVEFFNDKTILALDTKV